MNFRAARIAALLGAIQLAVFCPLLGAQGRPPAGVPGPASFIPSAGLVEGAWSGPVFDTTRLQPAFLLADVGPVDSVPLQRGPEPAPDSSFRLNLFAGESISKTHTGSLSITLTADGASISGAYSAGRNAGSIHGIAVSQNFFLLEFIPSGAPRQCEGNAYRGSASVMPSSPNNLTLSLVADMSAACGLQTIAGTLARN